MLFEFVQRAEYHVMCLKTLHLRAQQQNSTTLRMAEVLEAHPKVHNALIFFTLKKKKTKRQQLYINSPHLVGISPYVLSIALLGPEYKCIVQNIIPILLTKLGWVQYYLMAHFI